MKKIVVGIMVAAGIAALAAPFASGLIAERVVRQTFTQLNAQYAKSGHDIGAEIVRYDRGYSSSEIEWKINFGKLKPLYGVEEVVFIDRAEHGIGGITSRTSLEKNTWYKAFVNDHLAGRDPLHITTHYKITGGIEVTAAIDAFSLQAKDRTVEVKPGKVFFSCDKELQYFTFEGSWEGLMIADQVSIGGASLKSALTMITPYIWDGNVSMRFDSIGIHEGVERLELANLKVDYFLGYDNGSRKLSAKAEYGADRIALGSEEISKIFMRIGIKGVDAKGYEEFMKLYTATVSAILGDITSAQDDPEKMKQVLEKKMAMVGYQVVAAGEKLLTNGLELHLSDFFVQLPEGEVKGEMVVSLKKDMTFSQFIPIVNQPSLVLDIISLKSDISLPEKLVANAPMLFSPVYPGMKTGLFVKEGQVARHRAETRDGRLYVNEQELVLQ